MFNYLFNYIYNIEWWKKSKVLNITKDVITKLVDGKKVLDEPASNIKPVENLNGIITESEDTPTKESTKIPCPKCNKMLSARTLKYTHVHSCSANKPVLFPLLQTADMNQILENYPDNTIYPLPSKQATL